MEKKHKPHKVGMKRQRKTSLRGAASEPKTLSYNITDIPPIELDKPVIDKEMKKTNLTKNVPALTERDVSPLPKKKSRKGSANIENHANIVQAENVKPKKMKRKSEVLQDKTVVAPTHVKKTKKEKELMAEVHNLKVELGISDILNQQDNDKAVDTELDAVQEGGDKYPILKNKELIDRFLKVPMNNNQKGRIRQAVRLSLQGSSTKLFPDVINGKIQAILTSSTNLTDSELRRIRILYNMLKTALETPEELKPEEGEKSPKKKKDRKKKEKSGGDKKGENEKGDTKEQKVKGPKRYVVFLGNLPLDVNKEKIMEHFRELNEQVVDIRIPKPMEGKKSAIAYVELTNEPSYELALSKHHSMMGTKRINVLYTTQKKSKISKAQAKGKSAKLIAMQKAGKLVGSIPSTKTRSHRRNIMKQAKAKETAASN